MTPQANIERALSRSNVLHDWALRQGETLGGDKITVAYGVPGRNRTPAEARRRIRSSLDAANAVCAVALVSRIARQVDGSLDLAAMDAIPFLEPELLARSDHPASLDLTIIDAPLAARPRRKGPFPVPGRAAAPRLCQSATSRPALVTGAELDWKGPQTLPDLLVAAARGGRSIGFIESDGSCQWLSYANLLEEAGAILNGLRDLDIRAGAHALLLIGDNRNFLPALWACFLGGIVAVPIAIPSASEPEEAGKRLARARAAIDPVVLITDETGAEWLRGVVLPVPNVPIALVDELSRASRFIPAKLNPDNHALILFTSGSSAGPKLPLHSARSLIANAAAARQLNGFTPAEKTLNWFPLDHVGGLVMFHLRDLLLGCDQMHGSTNAVLRDPLLWLDWIERHRITVTWAPNFAYGLVARHVAEAPDRRWDLSSLWFILNGGEPIAPRHAAQFMCALGPHGLRADAMRPAWGMSETASGVTYSDTFDPATAGAQERVSVGRPVPGFSMRIVDAGGRVVAEGVTGKLQVRGAQLMQGYFRQREETARACTGDGWFDTGDLGWIEDGSLVISGRDKNVIILNGVNVPAHDIEAAVEELAGVAQSFTAAIAVSSSDGTERPVIFFCPQHRDAQADAITADIRTCITRRFGVIPAQIVPLAEDQVPKTAIRKIKHSELKRAFEAGLFATQGWKLDLSSSGDTVPDWFHRVVWVPQMAVTGIQPPGLVILFGDDNAHSQFVAAALNNRGGGGCVLVLPGASFERCDRDCFRVTPSDASELASLFAALASEGRKPARVVHCWKADPVASLLGLLAALRERGLDRQSLDLFWFVEGAGGAERAETLDPGSASLAGLLSTVELEHRHIRTRLIDVSPSMGSQYAELILAELSAPNPESAVVYREAQRMVRRLSRIRLEYERPSALALRPKSTFVVAGGLGGIGEHLCRSLLSRWSARLLVIGRRDPASSADAADGTTEMLTVRLDRLRQLGEVRYVAADVGDEKLLRAAVAAFEADNGRPVDAFLDLTATIETGGLSTLASESLRKSLASRMTRLDALRAVAAGRPLFLFSSLNGLFGGAGLGAYAAENSLVHAFARTHASDGVHEIAFSLWPDTGLSRSRADVELSALAGYQRITPEDGVMSIEALLARDIDQVLVGLDDTRAPAAWELLDAPRSLEALQIIIAETESKVLNRITDCFGRPIVCIRARRDALGSAAANRDLGAIESRVAAIWRGLLELEQLEPDANWFDLGGNSLLVPRLQKQVQSTLGLTIGAVEIFREPTLRRFTRRLASLAGERRLDNGLQDSIAAIWAELLDLREVPPDANFFDLGGHSLLVPRLQEQLRNKCGIAIEAVTVFRYPTVATLARHARNAALTNALRATPSESSFVKTAALARRRRMVDGPGP